MKRPGNYPDVIIVFMKTIITSYKNLIQGGKNEQNNY